MRKLLLFLLTAVAAFAMSWDANITKGELENGLKYYIKQNSLPKDTAYFYLTIRVGSIDESASERGLAHFVEHMAFNGSRDFKKNDLIRKLESLGVVFGADLNAYTSYDATGYNLKISVNDENLNDVFKVFSNWMDGISFDANELEKERGIIIEEERSRNTPSYRLYKEQAKHWYAKSAYDGKEPIGDMDVIRNVSVDEIRAFYERLYQPRFMEFVAVGDFDKGKIEQMIKSNFSSVKNTNSYLQPSRKIPEKSGFNIYNYDSNETGSDSISIAFFDEYLPRDNEVNARKILTRMLISQLFSTLYEKKMIDEGSSLRAGFFSSPIEFSQSMFSFSTNVIKNDYEEALSDMLGVIEGVRKFGFNESDFNDTKINLKTSINARYAQSKTKKSEDMANEILNSLDAGSILQSEADSRNLALKLLDEVTLDEVNAEFRRILALKNETVSVFSVKNFKLEKTKFDEIKSNAKPYDTRISSSNLPKNLVDENIKPKKIVSKSFDEKSGIFTLELENGATAILKPLKTKKDHITFAAVSKGGVSNLSDPKLGRFAVQVSNESGAGEFNNYQLAKILNGKYVGYDKRIDLLSQGFYGQSNRADIKWLLEAIHLEFNSPRLDQKTLEQVKTVAAERLTKRENLPEHKFSNEFTKFLYDNNERMRPLEKSDIAALELESLRQIVNDKFTNASSFDFIFVGDFEVETLEPLIAKYIATIPGKNSKENFVDDGVRSIKGVHKFERDYQITPRSDVVINLKNESVKFSQLNAIKAQALSAVFKMALYENIREDKGETYGFSVAVKLSKEPYDRSSANISFTCSPKNTNDVISGVKAIIKKLKSEGATKEQLENYKKSAVLRIKQTHDQPEFWLKNITANRLYDSELFDLKWQEDAINSLSNDDIKEAARLYLDESNEVISVNNPK
ncbi:pitrilysin family protein [Campylobacter sp. CCUG 57310]|uniref:M16 family metallopeptidase n=1 Tax=Campylobacter sp. CCUG 57310 TaxID=2517362 RepID=UPI0015648CF2|nr:M16 family metallopeptidase [Campylobacter sp. CCUG 57310]QKF92949.1 zinc-dependent peptidase, M16 family [Campylobacter sp. CCUG 57310]